LIKKEILRSGLGNKELINYKGEGLDFKVKEMGTLMYLLEKSGRVYKDQTNSSTRVFAIQELENPE